MTRQNEHFQAEELMSAYLDLQVTAKEKAFLEQHLVACAECRAQLEATRSMILALKAMPVVKAPRSFVLPRELARQPKPAVFAWYPALRFATVIAALALVILFSSDVLINRSSNTAPGFVSVPAAAPAPEVMMSQAQAVPPAEATQLPPAASARSAAPVETPLTITAEAAMMGGAAAKSAANDATPLNAPTATASAAEAASALEAIASPTAEAAQSPTDQTAAAARAAEPAAPVPAIDPWRAAEMALLGVVIALGAATLIARRRS